MSIIQVKKLPSKIKDLPWLVATLKKISCQSEYVAISF